MKVYKISRFHSEFLTPDEGVALKALDERGEDKAHVMELEFIHNRLWEAKWLRRLLCSKCGEAVIDRVPVEGASLPIRLSASWETVLVPRGQPLYSSQLSANQRKALEYTLGLVSDGKPHYITT